MVYICSWQKGVFCLFKEPAEVVHFLARLAGTISGKEVKIIDVARPVILTLKILQKIWLKMQYWALYELSLLL